MVKRLISFVIVAFFFITGTHSQTVDTHRLDSLFDALSANNLALGTISIAQDGKILYQRSFGKDASAATTYRVGSITKVFTATLIYQLIDQKILSVHDTLSEFFPDIANAGKITIDEMLGHRSGLADFTAATTDFDKWKADPHSQAELLSFIKSQQPAFEPNAKADYNNSNFLLLGFILEKIYHKPY